MRRLNAPWEVKSDNSFPNYTKYIWIRWPEPVTVHNFCLIASDVVEVIEVVEVVEVVDVVEVVELVDVVEVGSQVVDMYEIVCFRCI